VEKAKRYHLDIAGVSSTKRRGCETVNMDGWWNLFYSKADSTVSALTTPWLTDSVTDKIFLGSRVCILKF